LRSEGIDGFDGADPQNQPIWDKLLRFTGNRNRQDLLTDIGLGKRIANIVAKRLVHLLAEAGHRPDALLLTRERFTATESSSLGAITLDGSENASVQFGQCCRPIPGDTIVGYLGRGEGLVVHTHDCPIARKLQNRDSERFIGVDWAEDPVRAFETGIIVTVSNGKGTLAKVAAALASTEADIVHIDMGQEAAQDASDLRLLVSVRDTNHLEAALGKLRRTASVLRARRTGGAAER
jgi:GTP pyrophosphokinase